MTSPLQDLTAFQRDMLAILFELEAPNGQDVMYEMSEEYDTRLPNGRIYPNLDTLVDEGYVEKDARSRTENAYAVTGEGDEAYLADLEWRLQKRED